MWTYNTCMTKLCASCVQARLGTYSAASDSLLEVYYISKLQLPLKVYFISKLQNLHNLSLPKIIVSSYVYVVWNYHPNLFSHNTPL